MLLTVTLSSPPTLQSLAGRQEGQRATDAHGRLGGGPADGKRHCEGQSALNAEGPCFHGVKHNLACSVKPLPLGLYQPLLTPRFHLITM